MSTTSLCGTISPMTSTTSNFVIYAFYRERDDKIGKKGTIYYIGKGTPARPDKCTKDSRTKGAPCPRDKKYKVILHSGLDEDTAYEYERKLIQFYGRADLYPEWGILMNKTDGGKGTPGILPYNTGNFNNRRNWFHPVYGEIKQKALCEIVKLFPDQKLSVHHLSEVQTGERLEHKGWRKLENKSLISKKDLRISGDWVHEVHGVEQDLTIHELSVKYKNLDRRNLYNVIRKRRHSHKGWRILEDA